MSPTFPQQGSHLITVLQIMTSLISSANLQLAGFAFATVGWIFSALTMGLVQWRVWHISNTTIISSGIAWVGIWKVCFYSHSKFSSNGRGEFCHYFRPGDGFLPLEIPVAQALLIFAGVLGAVGKVSTIVALKSIYMGVLRKSHILCYFLVGGISYLIAGTCVLIAVSWNLYSTVQDHSISFPPSFYLPSKPDTQGMGAAILVGFFSAGLLVVSGAFLVSYKFPVID
ncbi:claudin-34 isoform X2 [Tachyglossus aculeatus]|nr:claudin-34 isoform X2 [Tachyglossus aculeatus]